MAGPRRRSRTEREDGGEARPDPDLGTYVSSLANAVYKGIAAEVARYDLSPLDIQLLMICLERNECAATQLAQLLPVDASRISRIVTGLADRGLLRRRRLRSDRRVVMLRLSPRGHELTVQVTEHMQAYYARLTQGLNEREMRAFATTAQRISGNYAAIAEAEESA